MSTVYEHAELVVHPGRGAELEAELQGLRQEVQALRAQTQAPPETRSA